MNIRISERMENDLFYGALIGLCAAFFLLICFLNSFDGPDFSFQAIIATLAILCLYITAKCGVEKGFRAGLKSGLGFFIGVFLGAFISPIVFFLEKIVL